MKRAGITLNPLTSEWLTCNFFSKFQYIIQQIGDEKIQIYQLKGVILIQHQIPLTDVQANAWQI